MDRVLSRDTSESPRQLTGCFRPFSPQRSLSKNRYILLMSPHQSLSIFPALLLTVTLLSQTPQSECRIEIKKTDFKMSVYKGDSLAKTFSVAVGRNSGDKQRSGDFRTPEGEFFHFADSGFTGMVPRFQGWKRKHSRRIRPVVSASSMERSFVKSCTALDGYRDSRHARFGVNRNHGDRGMHSTEE